MPQKKSQAKIAEFHQVDQATISRLKSKGVDIYDDDAIEIALLSSQKLAPNVKPRQIVAGMAISDITTIDEARFAKEVLLVKKESHKLDILDGESISLAETSEACVKIGSVMKASMLRIPHDNCQILEGKTSKEIYKILEKSVTDILQEMFDSFNKITGDE